MEAIIEFIKARVGDASKCESIRIGSMWKYPTINIICDCRVKNQIYLMSEGKVPQPVPLTCLERYVYRYNTVVYCGICRNCNTIYWGLVIVRGDSL